MPSNHPQRNPNSKRRAPSRGKSNRDNPPPKGKGKGRSNRRRPSKPKAEILQGPERECVGVLECLPGDRAYVRAVSLGFARRPSDPFVPRRMISQCHLRAGVVVEGVSQQSNQGRQVVSRIEKVNDLSLDAWSAALPFDQGTVIAPDEHLRLETDSDNVSMRMVDLTCPVGLGQRALIVAGARTGKTILLQQMAQAVTKAHPDMRVVMLLVDERPEEITDMRRTVDGQVFGSSNDHESDSHLRVARLTVEYVKRWVEAGRDVVLFVDSLTRLGRAFNRTQRSSGRTMSGGIDINALAIPRQIFGSARNIENGGSLTIVATILVDTGSRMDEVIFEEFKGTGNMELILDRALVEERIFPAINIAKSGTRREELLWGDATEPLQMLRRYLSKMSPRDATQRLIEVIRKTPSNDVLIKGILDGTI